MTPSTLPSSETLKIRPGNVVSPTKSTWLGPGVMQIELGAPITAARRCAGGRVAVDRVGSGSRRHVDGEHAQKLAVGIEHLDAPVGAIAHIDVVVAVRHDGVREAELPRPGALVAPGLHPVAVLVIFGDARVDVSVGDVDVAFGIPGDVGGLAEESVDWRAAEDRDVPQGLASSSAASVRRPKTIRRGPPG